MVSELDALKIENAVLKLQALEQQHRLLTQARDAAIEAARTAVGASAEAIYNLQTRAFDARPTLAAIGTASKKAAKG